MDNATDISELCKCVGKKNGEVKCFREGGTVFAFSWNQGARRWEKIGEVVSEAVQQKKQYEGDQVFAKGEYDFVFDVDMGRSMCEVLPPSLSRQDHVHFVVRCIRRF